ncbi:MAG: GNAT family N-acetyltransferase [Waterburya sp.]
MNTDIIVRSAQLDDLQALMNLWRGFMEFHLQYESSFVLNETSERDYQIHLEKILFDPDWKVVVAEISEVIGFGSVTIQESSTVFGGRRYGFIDDVVVSENIRGKGVGQKLSENLIQWCKEKQVDEIQLRIAVSNSVADQFWKKLGFSDFMLTLKKSI